MTTPVRPDKPRRPEPGTAGQDGFPGIPGADDPVWALLGRARQQPVRPTFARDVTRQARLLAAEEPSPWSRLWQVLTRIPALPLAAASAVALTLFVWKGHVPSGGNPLASTSPPPADGSAPAGGAPAALATAPDGVQAALPADVTASIPAGTLEEIAELEELNNLLAIYDIEILDDQELASLLF